MAKTPMNPTYGPLTSSKKTAPKPRAPKPAGPKGKATLLGLMIPTLKPLGAPKAQPKPAKPAAATTAPTPFGFPKPPKLRKKGGSAKC